MAVPGRLTTALLPATAVALLVAAPRPSTAWSTLREAGSAAEAQAPVLALVTLTAWALLIWLAGSVATTAGGHLPGQLGRLLAALARRIAPAAVRRTIEVSLGLTIAVGTLATPAAATPGLPQPPPAPTSLDWPVQPPTGPLRATGSAAQAVPAVPAVPALPAVPAVPAVPPPAPSVRTVVVQPGDTLWQLAKADLRARTGQVPADAQVATAWPSWWAANRDAVGADPHLLHPGTPLHPPGSG